MQNQAVKPGVEKSLAEQRKNLQQELKVQRLRLARTLVHSTTADGGYPRSMTMRFLTRRPDIAAGLLSGAATLLAGPRLFRYITAALALTRILQTSQPAKSRDARADERYARDVSSSEQL